jgi:hypothetical protein
MNQALAVMVNNKGLGLAQIEPPQPPKWASILTGISTGITTAIGAYQQARQPQQQQIQNQPPTLAHNTARPAAEADESGEENSDPSKKPNGIKTDFRFNLSDGLCIGGTCIPPLYLGLGAIALFLLYKEPPKGRR